MRAEALARPRPVPGRLVPLAAGAAVVVLALPVFALADWRLRGWALGALLWLAARGLGALVTRLRLGGTALASSGLVAVVMLFRAVAVMFVVFAVALTDVGLAVSAVAVYALAYTLELALLLVAYFSSEPVR